MINPLQNMWSTHTISSMGLLMSSLIYISILHTSLFMEQIHADSGAEEIELNVERISKLGNTDVLLSTISRLALALNKCGVDVRGLKELQRVMLPSNSSAKCMDGSNAGYYIRKRAGSKRWLIFLDGGYYCIDKRSCRARSENTPNLTSSSQWPLTKEGSGILSWNPEENPFLFSANIVYVPYCSSDAWSGNNTKNSLYFMGVSIINEVVRDLYKHGLREGGKLFFAGSSAGATGVLLNIDRVSETLSVEAPGLDVYGIVDSGWFLDTEQLHKTECTNTLNCPPAEAVKKGSRLWKPEIPKRCRRAYPNEPWRCFFGYRIYPYIKTPLFVVAYLYDRAQVLASMGGGFGMYHKVQQESYAKRNTEGITYMRELARLMNHTLSNVSPEFGAPSSIPESLRAGWYGCPVTYKPCQAANFAYWITMGQYESRREDMLYLCDYQLLPLPPFIAAVAVFAPSCMDHELLLRRTWHSVSIKGVSLGQALRCWEGSQETTNRPRQMPLPPYPWSASSFEVLGVGETNNADNEEEETNEIIRHPRNKLEREERRRQKRIRKQRKRQRAIRNRQRKIQRIRRTVSDGSGGGGATEEDDMADELLANALKSNTLKSYANKRQAQCVYKLFDVCANPNCNLHCPSYINVFSSNDNSNNNNRNTINLDVNGEDIYTAGIDDIENSIDDPKIREEIITRQR